MSELQYKQKRKSVVIQTNFCVSKNYNIINMHLDSS